MARLNQTSDKENQREIEAARDLATLEQKSALNKAAIKHILLIGGFILSTIGGILLNHFFMAGG